MKRRLFLRGEILFVRQEPAAHFGIFRLGLRAFACKGAEKPKARFDFNVQRHHTVCAVIFQRLAVGFQGSGVRDSITLPAAFSA